MTSIRANRTNTTCSLNLQPIRWQTEVRLSEIHVPLESFIFFRQPSWACRITSLPLAYRDIVFINTPTFTNCLTRPSRRLVIAGVNVAMRGEKGRNSPAEKGLMVLTCSLHRSRWALISVSFCARPNRQRTLGPLSTVNSHVSLIS